MTGLCIHCGARLDGTAADGRASAATATGGLCTRCDAAFWDVIRFDAGFRGAPRRRRPRLTVLLWVGGGLWAAAVLCLGLYLLLVEVVGTSLVRVH